MKKMPINKMLPIIIALIIVGGGAFYGGMKYAESKNSMVNSMQGDLQNFRNLSPEERQKQIEQMGDGRTSVNRQFGGGLISGEIISKNGQSITVKLRDGGSKIIFYSGATEVGKFVSGTADDLEIGKNVSITGITNSDGSVTAQSIQVRPNNTTSS